MPYIPEEHRMYNLLPHSSKYSGEVFSYPPSEDEIRKLLPESESVIPYGYKSYAEFYDTIDYYISKYGTSESILNELGDKLVAYKEEVYKMNIKENWSVMKYLGNSTPFWGLTKGQYYYWPCSIETPLYEGVIDDEEFTSYFYSTNSELWEIVIDPTGMAAAQISK